MDHIKILKRAWHTVWNYRALWVFGIIVGLATGGGSNRWVQYSFRGEDFSPGGRFHMEEIPPEIVGPLIAIGVGLACAVVVLIIAVAIARYVSETALIQMVDGYEETGEKRSVRQGFRTGWSRSALRLFLIDLLTGVPVALAFIVLFAVAAAPLLLWATESTAARAIGTVATIGLGLLVVLLAIVVGVILSVLTCFFRRVCALEQAGVIESIRQGYSMVRQHLKDVGLMWLIMFGVSIGWVIVMIPVTILLVVLGGVLGGLPGLLVGGLTSLAFEGAVPWILGLAVVTPIFILVVAAPLAFLGGLMEVFRSSMWTLTYRELRALENMVP